MWVWLGTDEVLASICDVMWCDGDLLQSGPRCRVSNTAYDMLLYRLCICRHSPIWLVGSVVGLTSDMCRGLLVELCQSPINTLLSLCTQLCHVWCIPLINVHMGYMTALLAYVITVHLQLVTSGSITWCHSCRTVCVQVDAVLMLTVYLLLTST